MVLVQRDPVTVRVHPFNAGLGFMVPASFMTGGGRRAARGGRTRGAGALSVTGYRGAHCSGKQTVLQREHKGHRARDRKSTRLNSSHGYISYAVFCLKKKKKVQ